MKDLFPVYLKNSYNSVIRKQPYKMDRWFMDEAHKYYAKWKKSDTKENCTSKEYVTKVAKVDQWL